MKIADLPKRLKEARGRTGLNRSEMARSLGVTRAAVSKWEK
ncbi:MAG: helix-turn-helix domain-containing protein, partial [Proteobacteria bacterium]|nr:helix-turn-helix domain-containing protein [Pseudomonadota bacterium]